MKRRELLRQSVLAGTGVAALAGATVARAQGTPGTTFDRVKQSKILRVAALTGEEPYFHKDIVTNGWSGACVAMSNDIAANFGAKVVYVESSYANSVLDLQSGKVDVAFALNPTPARAMSIDFTTPILMQSFTVISRKGLPAVANWADINKSSARVAVDLGSSHETIARHYLPQATITGFQSRDQAYLAVTAGRADYVVVLTVLAISALRKNPQLGTLSIPKPELTLSTNMGVRSEPDHRWRDFLSTWADYNRSLGNTRDWMLAGLAQQGIKGADVPVDIRF